MWIDLGVEMAVVGVELSQLWDRVVEHVSAGEPQHRAFLAMTKPLGLLQNEGGITSLLVAAPNAFAKDVLESRLRTVVNEVLTTELGEKANIAVMVDESIELADLPAPTVVIKRLSRALGPAVKMKAFVNRMNRHNLMLATFLKLLLSGPLTVLLTPRL